MIYGFITFFCYSLSLNSVTQAYITPVLKSSIYPPPSLFSSLAYYQSENRAIFYGGTNIDSNVVYSEFYSFDFETATWSHINVKSSLLPPSLYSSLSFIYKSKFYLLFGRTKTQNFPGFYSFDLSLGEWNQEYLKGEKIEPVVEPASNTFEFKGKLYFAIHGGVTSDGWNLNLYM